MRSSQLDSSASENLAKVLLILEKEFGQQRQVTYAQLRSLLQGPKLKHTKSYYNHFYRAMQTCIVLDSHQLDEQATIQALFFRLPEALQS